VTKDGTWVPGAEALLDHMALQCADEPDWRARVDRLRLGEIGLHLAIMREPFLGELVAGRKTMESRLSRVRCAPWGEIERGDLVAVKAVAGAVMAVFLTGEVQSLELHRRSTLEALRLQHSEALRATEAAFWEERAEARYATLIRIAAVTPIKPLAFPRRDRRGWVVLIGRLPSQRQQTLL
jgi:hypothetical protein